MGIFLQGEARNCFSPTLTLKIGSLLTRGATKETGYMRYLTFAFLLFGFAADAQANIVLDFSDLTTFTSVTGLSGQNTAQLTDDILINGHAYTLTVDFAGFASDGFGGFTPAEVNRLANLQGLSVGGDDSITLGERLEFTFNLAAVDPSMHELESFSLEVLQHGAVTGASGSASGVSVSDGTTTQDLANTPIGTGGAPFGTTLNSGFEDLNGVTLTIASRPTGNVSNAAPGSVEGIYIFDLAARSLLTATSVPEPSSVFMCGICFVGLAARRRRRGMA